MNMASFSEEEETDPDGMHDSHYITTPTNSYYHNNKIKLKWKENNKRDI